MTSSGESDTLAKESGQFKPPLFIPELIAEKYIIIKGLDDKIADEKKRKFDSLVIFHVYFCVVWFNNVESNCNDETNLS